VIRERGRDDGRGAGVAAPPRADPQWWNQGRPILIVSRTGGSSAGCPPFG